MKCSNSVEQLDGDGDNSSEVSSEINFSYEYAQMEVTMKALGSNGEKQKKWLEIGTEVTSSGTLNHRPFPLELPTGEFFLRMTHRSHFCTWGGKKPSQTVLFGSSSWGKSQNGSIGGTAASNQNVFTLLFIFLVLRLTQALTVVISVSETIFFSFCGLM